MKSIFKSIQLSIMLSLYGLLIQVNAQTLQWANTYPNTTLAGGSVYIADMASDLAGNLYVLGTFFETADFDPGTGKVLLTSSNESFDDMFLAKYTSSGSLLFVKQFNASGNCNPSKIIIDNANNILIAGSFYGTIDFDPGVATYNQTSNGLSDVFFAKYDVSGNMLFAFHIGSLSSDYCNSMTTDNNNKIYITGQVNGTIDFDPGIGTYIVSPGSSANIYYAVYDANGNFISVNSMGGGTGTYNAGKEILVNSSGEVFVAGTFGQTVDFDPSASTFNLTGSAADIFLTKFSTTGSLIYAGMISNNNTLNLEGMVLDNGGNVYLTGCFLNTVDFNPGPGTQNISSTGGGDIYLAKFDASWNLIYAKGIGSAVSSDLSKDMAINQSGQILITGHYTGTSDFDPSAGTWNLTNSGANDVFTAKYDGNGSLIAAKSISSVNDEWSEAVTGDVSGNMISGGYFTGSVDFDPNAGIQNLASANTRNTAFVSKLNASGNYLNAFMIGNVTDQVKDEGRCVRVGTNGYVYTTGIFNDTIDFDPGPAIKVLTGAGNNDIFILVTDANGNYINAISLGGSGDDAGQAIATDLAGNVYVCGYFSGTVDFDPGAAIFNLAANGKDIFFAKYDAALNLIYANKIGGNSNFDDEALAMTVDATGNLYLGGYFGATVDFDPGPGSFLLGGGAMDGFFAKYSVSGGLLFARRIGNSGNNGIQSLVVDNLSNIYLGGFFNNTCDFDPGAGTLNLTSAGSREAFFGKYDASGNLVFVKRIGSASFDECRAIALDGLGNIVIAGIFSGTVDMDPGAGTLNKVSAGGTDIFLSKYNTSGNHLFTRVISGNDDDVIHALAIDQFNNMYLTGSFYSTGLTFPPIPGIILGGSAIREKLFVARFSSMGGLVFAFQIDQINNSSGKGLALDNSLNLLVTGYYSFHSDFDPSGGSAIAETFTSNDLFLAKYGYLSPLPVELLFFNASASNQVHVECEWVTATETNNDYFSVMRSRDGVNFEVVGVIESDGNSAVSKAYKFTDTNPLQGQSYYCLQQTDRDGQFSLSKVVGVKFNGQVLTSTVFPNPSNGVFKIHLEGETVDEVRTRIMDLTGKLLYEKMCNSFNGLLTVDLESFLPGFYFMEVLHQDQRNIQKIQIIH